ncbi:MAG TPA: SGNH/GDSL hydrolase family protein [Xanthobacteraceae bacterium]|nr:SGNH/GDSL hydrolase family protein [Xanthobacteraceae bacterium]
MRVSVLAAILAIAAPASFAAGIDERCAVPTELIETSATLPNAALAIKRGRLDVMVVSGAPAQTAAGGTLHKYPFFLEQALRERLRDVEVRVFSRAEPRRTVMEIMTALPRLIDEMKPNLVVWQSGTIEALRGIDPDGYGRKLDAGVSLVQNHGADVLLVNPQFSPRTDFMIDSTSYTEHMRWVAQTRDVPFFNRFEVMRHWSESGAFDLAAVGDNGTFEQVHRCIGQLLGDVIVHAAALNRNAER